MRDLTKTHNSDIIILMEIKVNSIRDENIIQNLKMPNFVEIISECFSGRFWLLWKYTIDFQLGIISSTIMFIHCRVNDN